MALLSSDLIRYISAEESRKKLRYAGVSAVFVPIGQGLVQILGLWLNNYTTASILAAALVTVPNFFANKHFVWRLTSSGNLRSQVLVFWVAVMLGVLLATLFTNIVESTMAGESSVARAVAVFVAQILGLGIVWVGRFLMLDKWLFKLAGESPERANVVVGEIPV
ncbi:hypothetical protein MSAS_02870 [Mycobacterium saskatchewanense]|uniref:GtrA-like protein domain-containing protein n=1 Tax=Mycobacterium saskatchewanense TaxID=220927 RepID=A0AAJ3NLB9_9MYCO|nr:GtrA family protein [Mycobacterium saskatchewanense]ORW64997.1 hypothetical protein AWC23_24535 [Mycobacterium saskatchewanense]BBX61113.1 hypothetical protein MSAS_02870 [Mycobacterium saskatchewanense]